MLRFRIPAPVAGRRGRRAIGVAAVFALGASLAACSPTVSLDPGPQATDVACADLSVRLPDTLDGQDARETNAQGTAAWGDPTSVLLVCGVPSLGPTTDRCIALGEGAGEVDWVEDDSNAPRYTYRTYNRTPAVEVTVDNTLASVTDVLTELTDVVAILPADHACVGADDVDLPTPVPTP